jgi:hypothetical protein
VRGTRNHLAWTLVTASAVALVAFTCSAAAPARDTDGRSPDSANEWSAPQAGPHARTPDGIFGVVPAARDADRTPHRPTASEFAGTSFATVAPLSYHGGPVMTTNKTYAIYWLPSGSSVSTNYTSLINRYFSDVDAASGSSDNVYATDTQYYQGSSAKIQIAYDSTFSGTATDSTTPIPDHCSSRYSAKGLTVSGCVTDADIQAEISAVISANGWTPSPSSIFLLFTPRNVGSCITSASNTCSYTYYCAYHSDFVTGTGDVLYANQPYPDSAGVGAAGACDSGQKPNGDWADQTINLISHEHNESITDPNGNAWYDSSGNENGDKCAWNFGTALGSTGTGQYNQVINGNNYYVQQEWSNATSNCALGFTQPAPPTVSGFTPTSGPSGTNVTITGTSFTGATTVSFNGANASFTVNSATQITAKVPSGATSGPITVTTPTGSAPSAGSFSVTPTPDFAVSATPTSQTVKRGSSTSYTVSVTPSNGFAGNVSLKASGVPNRASGSFNPSTVAAGGSSTLTLTTQTRTATGTYTLTVTGTSGGLSHTAKVTLVVQ